VLFDFRFVFGDRGLRFDDGTAGIGHADVISDAEKRRLLIQSFVQPLVMTEGPALMGHHLSEYAQSAFKGGWASYLAWTTIV
jgi:hypothetical protein